MQLHWIFPFERGARFNDVCHWINGKARLIGQFLRIIGISQQQ